jgi:N-acetylmuramoyl-L-alanine amidase
MAAPEGKARRTTGAARSQSADAKRRRRLRRRRMRGIAVLFVLVIGIWLAASWLHRPDTTGASATSGSAIDPAAFSKGACVSLPPTHGDRHQTVFLDAGHGGRDPGAVGSTQSGAPVHEADLTLAVELATAARLRAKGYQVVVSRTTNSSVVRLTPAEVSGTELSVQGAHDDVAARSLCADLSGASVLVGIYFDSGSSPSNAGSVTAYDTARPFAAASLHLAQLLQTDMLGAMNKRGWDIPDDGVVSDSTVGSLVTGSSSPLVAQAEHYGHLLLLGPYEAGYNPKPSTMPGAVIEPLFVTDPFEASIATTSDGQSVMAGALTKAIGQYLSPPARNGARSTAPNPS